MRYEKKLVLSLASICVATSLLFTGCNSNQNTNDTKTDDRSNKAVNTSQSVSTEEENKEVKLNPFGNTIQKKDMDEKHMLSYIHYMSHQKVKAEHKWGFYLITDERIQWLLEALDEAGYSENGKYREILTRWANGDFSQIDKDHNYVWEIQGGTKEEEKATGILSKEEEKEYIENTEDLENVNIEQLGTID